MRGGVGCLKPGEETLELGDFVLAAILVADGADAHGFRQVPGRTVAINGNTCGERHVRGCHCAGGREGRGTHCHCGREGRQQAKNEEGEAGNDFHAGVLTCGRPGVKSRLARSAVIAESTVVEPRAR